MVKYYPLRINSKTPFPEEGFGRGFWNISQEFSSKPYFFQNLKTRFFLPLDLTHCKKKKKEGKSRVFHFSVLHTTTLCKQ